MIFKTIQEKVLVPLSPPGPIADNFTWGTMYGGNETGTALAGLMGKEYLSDVISYNTKGGDSYVITCATSSSHSGTYTNSFNTDLNHYPLAKPNLNAFLQEPSPSLSLTDIAITRFKVNNHDQNLNTDEQHVRPTVRIYPNPTNGMVRLFLESQKIHSIKVFDIHGKCMIEEHLNSLTHVTEIDLSSLSSGVYITLINDKI